MPNLHPKSQSKIVPGITKARRLTSFQPFCDSSQSKYSYLKAFKKHYIERMVEGKIEKENRASEEIGKRRQQPQTHKASVMTACSKNQREKSLQKITQSKIVDMVNNNDSQLQEIVYSSISEVQNEMITFGKANDLAKENKLLKASIANLKNILRQKLQVALQKNKQEITTMFEEYSKMIKKLLEDKENLTNLLAAVQSEHASQKTKWQMIEQQYKGQIAEMLREHSRRNQKMKQQIQEFLQVISQYEEEAGREKMEVDNLRQKLVELEMQNDRLQKDRDDSLEQYSFNSHNTHTYLSKIKSLMLMLNQAENQNTQLKQFLKNCKCSSIKPTHSQFENKIEQIINKYERQTMEVEKEYYKELQIHRQALNKKDQCIDRLNLLIEQLRKQRYESVDKMTQSALQDKMTQSALQDKMTQSALQAKREAHLQSGL